ncbi:MAG: DUF3344 domain-containing protein [Methanoregulaceae archaeon]
MSSRRHLSSPDLIVLILISCVALTGTAGATYAADRPLNTTYFGELNGDYLFSMGDSVYTSSIDPGQTYQVNFSIRVPDDATITFQRLYVYWAWSRILQQAFYPVISLQDSRSPSENLVLLSRYTDSKGVVGTYDFYTGMDVYDLPALNPGQNDFTVTLLQDGPPNSSVLFFGMGVLVVYENRGFETFTAPIDRYPGPGETVDLYAMMEARPLAGPTRTPFPALTAVLAIAGLLVFVGIRRRSS